MSARTIERFAAEMAAHGLTPPQDLKGDGLIHRFSTNGKRNDTAGGYVLYLDRAPAGAFWDWRTGLYVHWYARARSEMTPAERLAHEQRMAAHREQSRRDRTISHRKNLQRVQAMWGEAVPVVTGDPVHRYLRSRGLDLRSVPNALRLHKAVDYWELDEEGKPVSRGSYPAMLAAVQMDTFPNGRHRPSVPATVALHRTYLTPDGVKADVPSPKKLTGAGGDMRGASIRLAPPALIGHTWHLGVAEGIETALAAAEGSGVPTWAAVSANGMKTFQWPRMPLALHIFADNDQNETGQRAASELARKAADFGLEVRTLIPPEPGSDWADVWKRR